MRVADGSTARVRQRPFGFAARWLLLVLIAAGATPARLARAQRVRSHPAIAARLPDPAKAIQAEMRRVDFHVDSSIVIHIDYLRGTLAPAIPGHVPYFDDKRSFIFRIDTARIAVGPKSLGDLLNRYVFAYRGSPIHDIRIALQDGKVIQRATTKGIRVTTVSTASVTPSGEVRLHPTSIKAAGIPVGGALRLLRLSLEHLVNLGGAHGVRFDGDDLLLSVDRLLPPPRIQGRVVAVAITDSAMVQIFAPASGKTAAPLSLPVTTARNFMYYRDGVLRFGRLTMTGTDLLILDADPSDWFDFYLDRYNDQLVAGYSRTTPTKGLVAVLADFDDAARAKRIGNAPNGLRMRARP